MYIGGLPVWHVFCRPQSVIRWFSWCLLMARHQKSCLCCTCISWKNNYTPRCTTKLLGGILVSLRPSRIPCPLCSFYSSGWIHFIFIHLIKQLQKVCRVQSSLQNLKIWSFGNFLKFVTLTWDLMWITSMGNHGAAGGISERRRSSCSSFSLLSCLNCSCTCTTNEYCLVNVNFHDVWNAECSSSAACKSNIVCLFM